MYFSCFFKLKENRNMNEIKLLCVIFLFVVSHAISSNVQTDEKSSLFLFTTIKRFIISNLNL